MLTTNYRNGSIGYILGKREFIVPDIYYFGLSITPINSDGSGITEPPASSNYARVELPNNINTWNAPTNGVVTNKIQIKFPEINVESGMAVYYFIAEGTSGSALWFDELPSPRPLAQYTQVFIDVGDAQYAISNTQSVPSTP